MAPRPWRSKPSPRVDPTRANGEHEACARAPDGAGGGGRAYRRAYRRMKGTRAGALWTHSDACVGRSPHNIHDPGCITGSAVSSARRARARAARVCFGGVVYVKCSGARTERNLLSTGPVALWTGTMRRDATRPLTPAGRAAAPHGDRRAHDSVAIRTHRRDIGRESTRSSTRGAGGAVPGGRSVEREPGTRAPGVDPGDARAKRAPAALAGVVGSRDAARSRAGPRVSRHSCPDVVSAPTRAARSAAAEPIRTQAPGDARRRPRRRGPERPRGGRRETVRRAFAGPAPLVPRRSRSSGRPARTPTRCTKKFMRLPPPPRRGRSVVRTATVALVVKTLASRTPVRKYRVVYATKSRTRNLT